MGHNGPHPETPDSRTYKVSDNSTGTPVLQIGAILRRIDVEIGDRVGVHVAGNGLLVVPEGEAWDVPERLSEAADRHAHERDAVDDGGPLTPFKARVAGNRLWTMGERFFEEGHDNVAKETQQLARELHDMAGTRGGDDE